MPRISCPRSHPLVVPFHHNLTPKTPFTTPIAQEDLSLCISLVSIFTLIFTFVTPLIAIALKLPYEMAGAFMGGCVNNTANVIAAAGIIDPSAVETAGIVKMIQVCKVGI